MQVVFHIVTRDSLKESLRELVIADLQKGKYDLEVESEKRVGRRGGWAKVKAINLLLGVINITWHANSRTLVARAIARQQNTPHALVGSFLGYLLERRSRDIRSVAIFP